MFVTLKPGAERARHLQPHAIQEKKRIPKSALYFSLRIHLEPSAERARHLQLHAIQEKKEFQKVHILHFGSLLSQVRSELVTYNCTRFKKKRIPKSAHFALLIPLEPSAERASHLKLHAIKEKKNSNKCTFYTSDPSRAKCGASSSPTTTRDSRKKRIPKSALSFHF